MNFAEYFAAFLPAKAPPYHYQQRVADCLLKGNSLILQAPTGAGKTWAAANPDL